MNKNKAFAQDYLREAYRGLGFDAGELLDADDNASAFSLESWVDKGEWLSLAKQVGAEKLFFVNNNPVAVFASCKGDDEAVLRLFNRVWCMARPSYLFIARDGELSVYGLDRPPVRKLEDWLQREPLELVTNVNDVATKLKSFARDQIESGRLFEEEGRFGKPENRADQRLISDLREVRAALIGSGLAGPHLKYAHALIGRVIFIRYLEDRDILPGYFEKVAAKADRSDWLQMLRSESSHGFDAELFNR